jgi:dTDP-4-dehydrorhamnose reductase
MSAAAHTGRRILVSGARGQIGHELLRCLAPLGHVVGLDREALDLASADSIRRVMREIAPDVVVNAAAYTAVDKAEEEPAIARRVNGEAPGVLAEEAARNGTILVHYSTDYVFDGQATRPYRETDATAPVSVYGRTKLAGEDAALAAGGAAIVLRTGWVYGLGGRSFLLKMQHLAREHGRLRVVEDQLGTPTWSRFVAQATATVLARLELSAGRLREQRGIYHLACDGIASWCEFARAIVVRTPGVEGVPVEGIATADYPMAATRPAYSVLDSSRATTAFGLYFPPWREVLAQALDDQTRFIR